MFCRRVPTCLDVLMCCVNDFPCATLVFLLDLHCFICAYSDDHAELHAHECDGHHDDDGGDASRVF